MGIRPGPEIRFAASVENEVLMTDGRKRSVRMASKSSKACFSTKGGLRAT